MNWFIYLMSDILFSIVLLQGTVGFDIYDGEHQQVLLPPQQIDNTGYISLLEDQGPSNGILSYVRPGRRMFKLPQTLIPYPRTGRMSDEDDDLPLIPDYHWCNVESDLFEKKMSPRLGRKKRSISSEESDRDEKMKNQDRPDFAVQMEEYEELEPSIYFRQLRRPNSRSRNSFVPRVGKRVFEDDFDEMEDKRAVAFTPRIGRALIPRIGRNDPRFKVKSRGAFIPRIGRRASLTPRIGRSQEHHGKSEST